MEQAADLRSVSRLFKILVQSITYDDFSPFRLVKHIDNAFYKSNVDGIFTLKANEEGANK